MDELEKFFKCPHCFERISMILDVSLDEYQTYVEDCEVCCRAIQVSYACKNHKIADFNIHAAYD